MTDKYALTEGTWLLDGSGNIVSTDFVGIAKAQSRRWNKGELSGTAEVKVIGIDGEPVEIE